MAENATLTKKETNPLTVVILIVLVILAVVAVFLSLTYTDFFKVFLPGVAPGDPQYIPGGVAYEAIFILLTIATDMLYILGGAVIAFGAVLLIIRFLQSKLRDPYQPSGVSRYLAGYLTLSLEFFIGAEIIKTVVVRTYAEFLVLILVILSRGLFSLILYLERRWHGGTETE
jgi:uncharacterized membrane protein